MSKQSIVCVLTAVDRVEEGVSFEPDRLWAALNAARHLGHQ
jgi:hypothetical protein